MTYYLNKMRQSPHYVNSKIYKDTVDALANGADVYALLETTLVQLQQMPQQLLNKLNYKYPDANPKLFFKWVINHQPPIEIRLYHSKLVQRVKCDLPLEELVEILDTRTLSEVYASCGFDPHYFYEWLYN